MYVIFPKKNEICSFIFFQKPLVLHQIYIIFAPAKGVVAQMVRASDS
jgi:hypothetical protein